MSEESQNSSQKLEEQAGDESVPPEALSHLQG